MSTITQTTGATELAGVVIGRDGGQSRARYPDAEAFVERDGQQLFYEVYGEGEETIFLIPTWSLVHSRHWKMQIPYFARHFRVLAMDGLGNGRSERCRDPQRYAPTEFARDCLAVMDASGTERAVVVSLSRGAQYLLELVRLAPERVAGAAFIAPMFPYMPSHWSLLLHPRFASRFAKPAPVYRWWGRMNAVHWMRDYPGFATWFISRCLPEPHSTKAIEDGVGWRPPSRTRRARARPRPSPPACRARSGAAHRYSATRALGGRMHCRTSHGRWAGVAKAVGREQMLA